MGLHQPLICGVLPPFEFDPPFPLCLFYRISTPWCYSASVKRTITPVLFLREVIGWSVIKWSGYKTHAAPVWAWSQKTVSVLWDDSPDGTPASRLKHIPSSLWLYWNVSCLVLRKCGGRIIFRWIETRLPFCRNIFLSFTACRPCLQIYLSRWTENNDILYTNVAVQHDLERFAGHNQHNIDPPVSVISFDSMAQVANHLIKRFSTSELQENHLLQMFFLHRFFLKEILSAVPAIPIFIHFDGHHKMPDNIMPLW